MSFLVQASLREVPKSPPSPLQGRVASFALSIANTSTSWDSPIKPVIPYE